VEIERPPVGIKMPLAQGDWKAVQASTLKSRPRRRSSRCRRHCRECFPTPRVEAQSQSPDTRNHAESSCRQMCTTSYVVAETDLTRQQVTQMTIVPT
jgi:hypothetical protein